MAAVAAVYACVTAIHLKSPQFRSFYLFSILKTTKQKNSLESVLEMVCLCHSAWCVLCVYVCVCGAQPLRDSFSSIISSSSIFKKKSEYGEEEEEAHTVALGCDICRVLYFHNIYILFFIFIFMLWV